MIRLSHILNATLAAACLTLGALPATAGEAEAVKFKEACELHAQGRHSAAYGRFVALADGGHVNAARHALAMLQTGPTLYNTQWTASPGQLQRWTRLASTASLSQNIFVAE